MEKMLTSEEKIKRAEAIYMRRRVENKNRNYATVNVDDKNGNIVVIKMIIRILICITIYIIFYLIQNNNYIFSESFLKKASEILNYDINIQHLYNETLKKINETEIYEKNIEELENSIVEEKIEILENVIQETLSISETKVNIADEEQVIEVLEETSSGVSQMGIDVKTIKEKISFIRPIIRNNNF